MDQIRIQLSCPEDMRVLLSSHCTRVTWAWGCAPESRRKECVSEKHQKWKCNWFLSITSVRILVYPNIRNLALFYSNIQSYVSSPKKISPFSNWFPCWKLSFICIYFDCLRFPINLMTWSDINRFRNTLNSKFGPLLLWVPHNKICIEGTTGNISWIWGPVYCVYSGRVHTPFWTN